MNHSLKAQLIDEIREIIEYEYPSIFALFRDYNMFPELGMATVRTAARQSYELRAAGYEVIEGLAETGVVGVLQNGDGPTLLFRADMDALPVSDERNEEWQSQIEGVGHQCGHSMHSANLIGIARCMALLRKYWHGTMVFVAQPGEEFDGGAQQMIDAGLMTYFPKPIAALAFHVSPTLPGGTIGIVKGWAMALLEMPVIEVRGIGGHGGYPATAKDAIVLASNIILRMQTIVSREISPFEPTVISVCAINGGENHNILPDKVTLKLTVRCFSVEVYEQIMQSIVRICNAEAEASGLPKELYPIVTYRGFITKPLFNDEALAENLESIFQGVLGDGNVRQELPYTYGEDFSSFGLDGQIPLGFIWLGSANPNKFDLKSGMPLPNESFPPLHNKNFNPHPESTIRTAILSMTMALITLFNQK